MPSFIINNYQICFVILLSTVIGIIKCDEKDKSTADLDDIMQKSKFLSFSRLKMG